MSVDEKTRQPEKHVHTLVCSLCSNTGKYLLLLRKVHIHNHVTGLQLPATVPDADTVVVVILKWWHVVEVRLRRDKVKPTAIIERIAHLGGRMRLRGTHSPLQKRPIAPNFDGEESRAMVLTLRSPL